MLFPDISPSREQAFAELAEALVGKSTRIYLDASLLIRAYEVSLAARDELLEALESFGDRLAVPLWAARETWEFMRGRISPRPLQAPTARLRKELDRFRSEALRYVDDDTLSDLSKAEYQAQLDTALKGVRDLARRVASHEPKSDTTTARLMPFIEAHRLNSDIDSILETVGRTAATRIIHSIPPGFADSQGAVGDDNDELPRPKKGKQINPHGDLIIWFETLQDCAAKGVEQLVIITRDTTKGDWVYVPAKVRDEQGRPQENAGQVTMPSPLLVHEALRSCPRLRRLHVVSLEMFAHVLQRNLRVAVPNLAAALQAGDEEPRRGSINTTEFSEGAVGHVADEAGDEPTFGSADMTYDFPRGDEIDELLRSLSVEGWRVQNQAVRQIEPLLGKASRDQLVQIGRGLAGAANDGALEPIDLIRRVFGNTNLSRSVRSGILIGVLAQIYVAESGEPKKPKAHPDLISLIYDHERDAQLESAYTAVLKRLTAQRRTYLGLPTDHVSPVPLEVTLEGKRIRAVKAFGNHLLEEDAPATRALRLMGQEAFLTADELLAELSREFVVPVGILSSDIAGAMQLQLPENIGYVPWGPNTGAVLR